MNTSIGVDALFDFATEGILVANAAGEITMINSAAEKMFGYTKGELTGKPIEILIPRRLSGKHIQERENYNHNPQPRKMGGGRDLKGIKKDGAEFPVEVSLSPFESPNGKFTIAFIIDITVRKQYEDEMNRQKTELEKISTQIQHLNIALEQKVEARTMMLRETLAQLEKSKNELSASLEKEKELGDLKSRFVSTVSHEFRTPLSSILSSASLIGKYTGATDGDKREKHVLRIKESVKQMSDMLEDLLSLGKLEEGLIIAKPAEFNVKQLLNELRNEMLEILKNKQDIVLHFSGDEETYTDKRLLKNILTNLLSNALKFSTDGQAVEIKAESTKDYLKIEVKDSGIGISEEEQQHLFERFFRARNAANIQGTGLGLHIVSRYLELLKGEISLQSELNSGTSFTIRIPVTETM